MTKNFADIYNSSNDAIALEQRWFAKLETTRGQLIAPTGTDFIYTLQGGQIDFTQPFESSPHRSGRHHTSIIKKKKTSSWSFPTYFNVDSLASAGGTEIDPAARLLWTSLCGHETVSAGIEYKATVPNTTFSLFENGDKFARQGRGCFVQGGNITLPGDGEAKVEWTGANKDALYLGIGKSVTANSALTVTLAAGDGDLFKKAIGGLVMIIKSDGFTRSTDTPDGTPRKIVSVSGDVVTLDGVSLTDSDGSSMGAPVYLCYYEPATPTAINDPQTGLVGSLAIAGFSGLHCARSISLNLQNNHELVNYCYGMDSLDAPFFVPGSRFTAEVSVEMNLNKDLIKFFNSVQSFDSQALTVVLGPAAGRRVEFTIPKAFFPVPSFSVPESGSIPVTFAGTAYQTALDAGDELSVYFK